MTYVIRSYVVFFSIFLIATNSSLLYSQNYYSWNSNTGNNAIIGILLDTDIMVTGEPIQPGDEIGVFTPEGLCVGGIKWCGEKNHALTVWGNNEMTTDTIDGIQEGEEMQFRIWRQETETEYEIAIPVYSLGDGVYTTNGVYVLETLTVEGISFYPIRPQNYEVDVSINPELTWESLDDVESYSVQIATDEMFDTIDLQFDNINTTSIVLENLDYLTTYYWRVGALMDDGSYYWTRMMTFTTESELRPTPPALVHPGSGAMQVDISPVLSWNSKGDDVSYNLQIALDQEFMGVQQTMDDIPDTTIMVSNLNYGVRYYWRVQASNNEGTSDWSTVRYFTTRNEVDSTKIYFSSGWNMVSSYIKPENASMEHTLTDIENNYVLIKDGAGKVYWPDAEIYELDTWEVGQGYQIYMHSQDSLVITGNKIVVDNSPIELEQGWNAIAYLHESPLPITEALASIDDYIVFAKTIDGNIYWPEEDWNTIHNMFPGFGYYIYVNSPVTLYYPGVEDISDSGFATGSFNYMAMAKQTQFPMPRIYNVPVTNTGLSATLLIKANGVRDESEVGVWNESNQLIGSGVVKNERAIVTVWGNNQITDIIVDGALEDEKLSLTLWSSWDTREHPLEINRVTDFLNKESVDKLRYQSNSVMIASVGNPLSDVPHNYRLYQNFPNPFNPSTTIRYTLPQNERVKLEVFNLLGQRIDVLVDEEQHAGYHQIEFHRNDLASGVYIYRLTAGYYVETKRMILTR